MISPFPELCRQTLPLEVIGIILEVAWLNTSSSKDRLALYRTLSQVSPVFHAIAAGLPPIIYIGDYADLDLFEEMRDAKNAFSRKERTDPDRMEATSVAPGVARLYLEYEQPMDSDSDESDSDDMYFVATSIGDCRSASLRYIPREDSDVEVDWTELYNILASFPSLTHLCLYHVPEGPHLPTLTSLCILTDSVSVNGEPVRIWHTLDSTLPELRRLHVIGPLDARELKLPSNLQILILDSYMPTTPEDQWGTLDLTQYRLSEALRGGVFSSTACKTIVIRSPPPVHWFEPTQRVGARFGVRIVQEVDYGMIRCC